MKTEPIPPADWGRDHWSTFGYIEVRVVDHKGVPDRRHMRCDPALHPHLAHDGSYHGGPYPTRLRDGERQSHDDWSCLDDAIAAGFVCGIGTGLHPVYALTPAGREAANALRAHKAAGGSFSTFKYPPT